MNIDKQPPINNVFKGLDSDEEEADAKPEKKPRAVINKRPWQQKKRVFWGEEETAHVADVFVAAINECAQKNT